MKSNPFIQVGCTMSKRRTKAARLKEAFTRVDLFVVVATVGVLAGLVLPLMANPRARSEQVMCANNLRQIGQAIRTWGADHGGKPPWMVSRDDGGLRPIGFLNPWQVFAFMSDARRVDGTRGENVFGTPRILVCPSDTFTLRRIANDWDTFVDNSRFGAQTVSYFIGLHTPPEEASSWMSGDGNLNLPVRRSASCLAGVNNADGWCPTNAPIVWTTNIHGAQGNILQTSGAVLQLDNSGLSKALNTNSMMVNFESTPAVHLLLP